jgi:hypothetical protein
MTARFKRNASALVWLPRATASGTDVEGPFGTIFFGAGLVDDERPSAHPFTLQPINGGCVPVIAVTAHVLDQSVVDAGFQRLLRKPFAPDQLVATIDSVFTAG